ncbi:MAG TPA: helix-turn-helix transcriptional regulator [Firmicutes bacterium]|nr:helix-turn-helix transcriptional regulator [Bacillota bacterium]
MAGYQHPQAIDHLQLRLRHVGQVRLSPAWRRAGAAQQPFTEICYVLRGAVGVRQSACEYTLHSGELMIIPAFVSTEIWNASAYEEAVYLTLGCEMELDGTDLFAGRELHIKQQSLPPAVTNLWIEMAEYSERYAEQMDALDRLYLSGKARMWLAEFCRFTGIDLQTGLAKIDSRLQQALQYMRSHFHKSITMAEVAREVNVSEGHLRALFKSEMGVSFRTALQNMRISQAKTLLLGSDLAIGEIAIRTGFNDVHHFSRTFTKVEGVPPSVFRSMATGAERLLFEDHFTDAAQTEKWWSVRHGAGLNTPSHMPFYNDLLTMRDSCLVMKAPGEKEWGSLILKPDALNGEALKNYVVECRLTLQNVQDPINEKIGIVLRTGFFDRILFVYRLQGFASFSRVDPEREVTLAHPVGFVPAEGQMIEVRLEVRGEHVGSHVSFYINNEFVGARRFSLLQGAQQIGLYVHLAEGVFDYFRVTNLY